MREERIELEGGCESSSRFPDRVPALNETRREKVAPSHPPAKTGSHEAILTEAGGQGHGRHQREKRPGSDKNVRFRTDSRFR